MDISSAASVGAYASQKATAEAKEEAAMRVFRMAVDGQSDAALQLIQSVTPTSEVDATSRVGQNLNVRA